jgi:hypothetical protein
MLVFECGYLKPVKRGCEFGNAKTLFFNGSRRRPWIVNNLQALDPTRRIVNWGNRSADCQTRTVEAALIVKELLNARPGMRILYLAPARLVGNVANEFARMDIGFQRWVAGEERDGNLATNAA